MNDKGYFAHISPSGEGASDIAQRVGYKYKILAENLGMGSFISNQKLVNGWLQSPGHKRNILNPEIREIGAAVLRSYRSSEPSYYSVQIFGLESPPVTTEGVAPNTLRHGNSATPEEIIKYAHNACLRPFDNIKQITLRADRLRAEISHISEENKYMRERIDRGRNEINYDKEYLAATHFDRKYHQTIVNEKISSFNQEIHKYNNALRKEKAYREEYASLMSLHGTATTEYQQCLRAVGNYVLDAKRK